MQAQSLYMAQQYVLWGGLVVAWILESVAPRERQSWGLRARHGAHNLALWLIGILLVSILFGAGFANAAIWLERSRVGLLNAVDAPWAFRAVAGFLLLDFSTYVLHRLSHGTRILWLLHCVHHSDSRVDVTTNLRHHPLHVVCTMAWKLVAFAAIGPTTIVLIAHELLTIAVAHLHHSAIAWPRGADRWLSWLIISPRAHWVHHSCSSDETDSNYGATLSWWDRLAGTYVAPGRIPRFGLSALEGRQWDSAIGMLSTPFRARKLTAL